MNITLSVDEKVAQRAREAAQKMGKSLNQAVRDHLEQLAGSSRRGQEWAQFEARCRQSTAKLGGWKFNRDEAKISLCNVPDKPGIAYQILGAVAEANIEVDMIIQNISKDGKTDFSFTVHRNDFTKAMDLLKAKVLPKLGAHEVIGDAKICKVSIVGIGMRSHVGVASKMFRVLSEEGINIQMISTSEIKIAVILDESQIDNAAKLAHAAFGLSAGK